MENQEFGEMPVVVPPVPEGENVSLGDSVDLTTPDVVTPVVSDVMPSAEPVVSAETTTPAPVADAVVPPPVLLLDNSHKKSLKEKMVGLMTGRKKVVLAGAFALLLVIGVSFAVYQTRDRFIAVKQFTNVYSFVPEKVSKSAAIQINVPKGIDIATAKASIKFSPTIDGDWQTEALDNIVTFKPRKPLETKKYYAVNMDTGSVQMSGDFYVDDDPKITAIFPAAQSESHEDTKITIVFNRPMVALTTLTEQEATKIPVTITPATPGKFKWISTRNLQFVPDTTLIPSSRYTVEVGSGLYSIDGLPVAPMTQTFVTRPLRYETISESQIGYRAPIMIVFNQPVDLGKTAGNITVTKADGSTASIDVTYGDTTNYDPASHKYVKSEDKSKLFVYQKKDRHGRSHLWDFDTTYAVSVTGATPLAGTMNLEDGKNSTVSVANIVESVTAQSDRSSLVRPDLVDPQGTVTVTFFDDINKDSSTINVKGLKGMAYGERCKKDEKGDVIEQGSSCVKEPDTKTLILSFNPSAFGMGESFDLDLNKIKTADGFQINAEPIKIPLKTYPNFQILRTLYGSVTSADLGGATVCTNTPLKAPEDDWVSNAYVATTGYIIYGRWQNSEYIDRHNSNTKCNDGEFETKITYGLLPETDYTVQLKPIDAFGQSVSEQLVFKTSPPTEQFTRFTNMQQQYEVTSPDKTKFTYTVENLEYVDMQICKLSPEAFLKRTVNRAEPTTPPSADGCTDVVNKKISLPVRYWVNNYFQVNLADYYPDTRGQYIITFSNPLYKDTYSSKQLYDRTYVSVTNLAVGKKQVEYGDESWSESTNPNKKDVLTKVLGASTNLYWVSNSKTLEPVAGAVVTQFEGGDDKPLVQKTSGLTDSQGIARAAIHTGLVGAIVTVGADTAVLTDWADTLSYASPAQDASKTYVYTDRPIYRPGHTVHIRGIDRIGFDGKYEVLNRDKVTLTIHDSRDVQIYETNLAQNAYGTFNTDFDLPADAPLGTYRIEVFGQSFSFDVEEYVPSAFKLEATTSKEEYVNKDTFKVDVQADYYFGVPLDAGTVSYSVTSQDYYFDKYTDDYFNFGAGWYECYSCSYGDNFLFRGETTLDAKGHATIERQFNFDDYFKTEDNVGSKLVTVSITAKDVNGKAVSMQKSFIVHKANYYLGLKTDDYFTSVNTPTTLRVKTVDTTGKPLAIGSIEKTVSKVSWDTFKRQEVDGGFYYRSEKKLTEVSHETISTDGKGDWSGPLSFASEGEYEVQVTGTDSAGNKLKTVTSMYIYGTQAVSVPPNNNYELDVEAEKTNLNVGDEASLLIKSPYPKAKALITIERGTIYDYAIVDVIGGLYSYKFPVKSAYAPNIFVSVLLLSPDPEVKYGSVSYTIGTDEKKLDVEVKSDKTYYLPGETVKLAVTTKNNLGQGVPAEVSVSVADLSVLALKGNPKKNPLLFFYNGFPLSVSTASNVKNILHEVDIPLGTKGGGGAEPGDLAKKKRGLFKDTAFWSASVETDQNGQGSVTFTLPDNLTTWQIESLGITKDTKLGVNYQEFTTKKELMAVPLMPRFVVPGDTFSLGAKVFNQTTAAHDITVTLDSKTLEFKGEHTQTVSINPGESKTVYFDVTAGEAVKAGTHSFTFTAADAGKMLVDSVEESIAVTPNDTYETVATANATKDDRSVEYVYVPDTVVSGKGGLTINANATMAVFMTDALNYMVTYPYGCSEQLASSLSTIGVLTKALTVPNVEGKFDTITEDGVTYTVKDVVTNGLTKLYEAQTPEGGFAYYKGLPANVPLTIHVVSALYDLKMAGFDVRADVLSRGANYIQFETKRLYTQYPDQNKETVILAEAILRKMAPDQQTSLTPTVQSLINDKAFLNEKISTMSLAYLAILTAKGYGWLDSKLVYQTFENRIAIDGRGAYLASANTMNYDFYETSIKDTALAIAVFTAHNDQHETLPNMLRWLLASRDNRGAWGSTQNTFTVVSSLVGYLTWQHESESQFSLKGLLDGVELFATEFTPKTVFDTFTHFVPIDSLAKNKMLPLVLNKEDKNNRDNNLYYDMSLKYYLPVQSLPPRDEGISITRDLYALTDTRNKTSLHTAVVGDVIRGKITITIPEGYQHVAVEDFIPAGFEIVNFNLNTEDQSLNTDKKAPDEWSSRNAGFVANVYNSVSSMFGGSQSAQLFGSSFNAGGSYSNQTHKLSPTYVESHDDRVFLYAEHLEPGVYEYEYYLRALVPGSYQHLPARAEELYFPEIFGRTSGDIVTVTK
jgi:hypothetical protein